MSLFGGIGCIILQETGKSSNYISVKKYRNIIYNV
jgi:hypothetical protein